MCIAAEGGGADLQRVFFTDGTTQFMDEKSRLNGVGNVLLDEEDDIIRYDLVDLYFDTFDEYWTYMFPSLNGWWNLGFFATTEDVYLLVKEKFKTELSKLNFEQDKINKIIQQRVIRDFKNYKVKYFVTTQPN